MNNRFIACGGTGAHVMLAMVRLHMLGYPFGFFVKAGKKFPDLFLVDQDSGDGKEQEESTPWQEVKNLIKNHPGKYDLAEFFGRPDQPICRDVSPLPVGEGKDWYKPPNHRLKYKFKGSPILPLITSEAQREITYSLGMMASPAVGSLLFALKELDIEGKGKPNYDEAYNDMLNDCGDRRMVVCGSSVGGTGSSVTPTLARLCKEKKAEVMAIMVHRWFQFSRPDESREKFDKSVERNKVMKENAAGGLASYGEDLARKVPTVLVGVPDHRRILRQYTSDNQQPSLDSYAHAVGALAGIKYFLTTKDREIKEGLYGVSASDADYLTGDMIIKEDNGATLREMIGHAQILTYLLGEFSNVLRKTGENAKDGGYASFSNFFIFAGQTPVPAIVDWANSELRNDRSSLKEVADELDAIRHSYRELLAWISSLGKESRGDIQYESRSVEEKGGKFFLSEKECIKRLKKKSLPSVSELQNVRLPNLDKVECVALALFHWLAQWIKDEWENLQLAKKPGKTREGQGYWPDIDSKDDTGLLPTWGAPGELGKVADDKISSTIEYYFDRDHVSPNSWPHHIAVVEEYKFQIVNQSPVALRKLEMLLVGRALGVLELQKVEVRSGRSFLSLERLLKDTKIAEYRLIHQKSGKVYGFNSPETFLCPAPDVSNEDWESLWKDLTGIHWDVDWRSKNWRDEVGKAGKYIGGTLKRAADRVKDKVGSDNQDKSAWRDSTDWGFEGEKARKCVRGWLKCVESHVKDKVAKETSRIWVDVLDTHLDAEAGPFGVAEWLPLPGGDVKIPMPVMGDSLYLFEDLDPGRKDAEKSIAELISGVPEFEKCIVEKSGKSETFEIIKNFRLPRNIDYPIGAIWREHLDQLQETGKIFAWRRDQENRGIWIRETLGEEPIYIRNLQVIDRETIQIDTCVPLTQKSVNGTGKNKTLYPDIPLRPDYIDLLKIPKGWKNEGEKCIDHDHAWRRLRQSGDVDRGRKVVHWNLDLLGRSEPVPVTISVDGIESSNAHWMVWPNIKAPNGKEQWRAYYLYEYSPRLEAQTIYLNQEGSLSELKKRPLSRPGYSQAVDFKDGRHVGGPPVALSAYDHKTDRDAGIYVICLKEYSRDENIWKLAIDFGTSHTVAAYQINEKHSVNLDNELSGEDGLSLHISQNYDGHLAEMGLDTWRPTYKKGGEDKISKALLPSDLWSFGELDSVETERFRDEWAPMTHYAIPVMQLQRSDLQNHIISGFKWEMDRGRFTQKEQWLRERYLRMAIEIFLADIAKREESLPETVEVTFTYPLRGTTTQATSRYGEVVGKVLEVCAADLGSKFRLTEGREGAKGNGLYSESSAAFDSIGPGIPIAVKLVADLGGGTLDIFMATKDINSYGSEDRGFGEVAESVKMGSDLLLQVLARHSEKYLPRNRGWKPDKAFEQLRAWMRSVGSEKLFGTQSRNWSADALKLKGFEKPQDANDARELINRYFRVINDFLARNLVAYVAKNVLPLLESESDLQKLKLIVHLKGNGWRLWYRRTSYKEIQEDMEEWVKQRAIKLWKEVGFEGISLEKVWYPADYKDDSPPKLGPIKHAVGKSMSPEKAVAGSHRFPLSDVLLLSRGTEDERRNWYEKLPFEGVSRSVSLCIGEFNPPLIIHSPNSGEGVKRIEDVFMKEINDSISGDEATRSDDTVDAPIAALIWENVLKSREFQEG